MRLLKVLSTALFAAFAVLVGLFTAMLFAVGAMLVFVVRKLFGPTGSPTPAPMQARRPNPSPSMKGADVIDITATEVPPDRPAEHRDEANRSSMSILHQ